MYRNFLAILACLVGTVFAAMLPAHSQVSNGRVTSSSPTYTNNSTAPLSLDTSGNLRMTGSVAVLGSTNVQGTTASGAADAGNPVKTGAVFNTTPPTVSNGQRVDSQADANGNLRAVTINSSGTGADNVANTDIRASMRPNSSTAATLLDPSGLWVFDGTTWDRVLGNITAGSINVAVSTALPAGTNNIGDVDVASIATGTNDIGSVGLTAEANVLASTASYPTTVTVIKASAGELWGVSMAATSSILSFYDNASACSGTVRAIVFGGTTNVTNWVPTAPISFTTGISVCASATVTGAVQYK